MTVGYRIKNKDIALLSREENCVIPRRKDKEGHAHMFEKIKNMYVEKKLRTCFILTVLMASISGVLGIFVLLFTNSSYSKALVNNGFSQGEIGRFTTCLNKEATLVRELLLLDDAETMQQTLRELDAITVSTDNALAQMRNNCNTEEEKEFIRIIDEYLPQYRTVRQEMAAYGESSANEGSLELLNSSAKPLMNKVTQAADGLMDLNEEMGYSVQKRLTYQTYLILAVMLIIIAAAAIVSIRLARKIAAIFSEPIISIKNATAELAKGNLNFEIKKLYNDEIGEMTDSFIEAMGELRLYIKELTRDLTEIANGNFNVSSQVEFRGEFQAFAEVIDTLTSGLSGTMSKINEASEQVALGSGQMAESAQSLAEGATDQAGSVEELTATIQSITENVIANSENASKSYQSALKFEQEAETGNENIIQLNSAMERINMTSNEIANIISEIEDIASQTNLLSLNASIEAARAGEAGRGFAVVADQIGKLASDSANSAVNTKRLIENSIQEIEKGNEITIKTTKAIETVIEGIRQLAVSTKEISELSDTQADAMKQLELGVEQISEVIQSNSAAAQETSATSEELSAQSEALRELVAQFTIKS